jgi:hypothetical protein
MEAILTLYNILVQDREEVVHGTLSGVWPDRPSQLYSNRVVMATIHGSIWTADSITDVFIMHQGGHSFPRVGGSQQICLKTYVEAF